MPQKKQRKPVTPPSEDSGEEADGEFVIDPEQIFDNLPQPFRLIDKTMNDIFDRAWSFIEGIEDDKALRLSKECLPSYDCGRPLFDLAQPSCMCSDSSGKYLFVAHSNGFSVVEALIGQCIANYEDSSALSVIEMCACILQEGFYALSTLENGGVAKVFCFFGDQLRLAKVFTDEGNRQASASSVKLSDDGSYIGIGLQNTDNENWLEVYRIPKESWVKEAETALQAPKSRKPTVADPQEISADSNAMDQLKNIEEHDDTSMHSSNSPPSSRPESPLSAPSPSSFTRPTAILRVRKPPPVGPCAATNNAAALKAVDPENIIGTTNNHLLMSQYFEHSDLTFRSLHEQQVQYLSDENQDSSSTPTFHFLKPGKFVPSGLDTAPNKVNSLALWWSGETQLFIYSLVKGAKDIEIKPECVWPSAQQIHISAISDCLSILALGLKDGNVVVWDVHRGYLLRVCTVTDHAVITTIHFLSSGFTQPYNDEQPSYLSSPIPVANLAVACSDGSCSIIQSGVAYNPPIQPMTDKSAIHSDVIMSMSTLSKTPQVVATCKESGRVTFYDATTYTALCHVSLPHPYLTDALSAPCITADGQVAVIKGYCEDEDSEEEDTTYKSMLFTFPLRSFPSLDRYWRMAVTTEPYGIDNTIETRLDSLVQDRISSQKTRQLRMQDRWGKFQGQMKRMQSEKKRIHNTIWLTQQHQTAFTKG